MKQHRLTDEEWLAIIHYARWRGRTWRACLMLDFSVRFHNRMPLSNPQRQEALEGLLRKITPGQIHKIALPPELLHGVE